MRAKSITRSVFTAFLLGGAFLSLNAQNFVPNPSFETATGCVTGNTWTSVDQWRVVTSHSGSPDRFHTCAPGTFGVTANVFGDQAARTGISYAGLVTHFGGSLFREYLIAPLTTPLTGGVSYTATAYLSLSDGSGWATDGFGFYFSSSPVVGSGSSAPLPLTPQVSNPSGNYINSWTNWLPVSGNFVATPGMQYITIGNFKPDATTGVQVMPSGWSWNYTYMDDISVTPAVILSADMGPLAGEVVDERASLSWNTTGERGTVRFEIEHSAGDLLHFQKVGAVLARGGTGMTSEYDFEHAGFVPTKLNYYRVKEVDQNGEGGYTETITLQSDKLVNELGIKIFPNPVAAGQDITMEMQSTKPQVARLDVMDLSGRTVISEEIELEPGTSMYVLRARSLAEGCYLVRLLAGGAQATQRILVAAPN